MERTFTKRQVLPGTGRSRHRLADGSSIRRIVLLAAHIGLHVSGRHQPHIMAQRHQLPPPMVRRAAGLQPHKTGRKRRKERQKILALDGFGDNHAPGSIDAVNLKHKLGDIKPDSGDRR
jgi:hypothetical protein